LGFASLAVLRTDAVPDENAYGDVSGDMATLATQ
jgi:hypothetical protein